IVEIATIAKPAPSSAVANVYRVERRLAWQQDARILDLAVVGDEMLVLDTAGLTRYQRQEGSWKKEESATLDVPMARDARGHLTTEGENFTAEVAGLSCRGSWRPMFQVECSPGGRFTLGRNTIEEAGRPAYIARAEWSGRSVVAETDGSIRL